MRRPSFFLLSTLLLAACASERVTLLPGADGKVGAVVVTGPQGKAVQLDAAYAATRIESGDIRLQPSSAGEVAERYRATLAAAPPAPRSFTLQFAFDKTALLPESLALLPDILDEYRNRPAPEVVIIGHTDQSGNPRYNEDLSKRRAAAARDWLVGAGVAPASIEMSWRGDREPLLLAGKGNDSLNRRVEVKIR